MGGELLPRGAEAAETVLIFFWLLLGEELREKKERKE